MTTPAEDALLKRLEELEGQIADHAYRLSKARDAFRALHSILEDLIGDDSAEFADDMHSMKWDAEALG